MPDPTAQDWQELVEVLGPVADKVDNEFVAEQAAGENTDDSAGNQEDNKPEEQSAPFMTFSSKEEYDKHVEDQLKDRLARKDRKSKEEREKAEAEARRKALEDQQKYQELYENEAVPKIQALEGQVEKLERYEEVVSNYSQSLIDQLTLPKGVVKLLDKMDPIERLEWYTENSADFAEPPSVPVPGQEEIDGSGISAEKDQQIRQDFGATIVRQF